jgi:phosphatidylserine/phosphatidylglycerophosphate/cardiolipin synthase-like enzyme
MTFSRTTPRSNIPNSAVADALSFNPIGASKLLEAWSRLSSSTQSHNLIEDIAREANLFGEQLRGILEALTSIHLVKEEPFGLRLMLSSVEAEEKAAFLEGYAYARHSHKDANQVDITLSPPSRPSRLMEHLPRQGFAWAGLDDTKDNLVDLASRASKRLVIVSPFVDDSGLDWIANLFDTTASSVQRVLIVRAAEERVRSLLSQRRAYFSSNNSQLFSYAIPRTTKESLAIETFHAKVVLSDRDRAYIGSSNMNLASREISLECGVTLTGPCVRPVATLIETIISISERLQR